GINRLLITMSLPMMISMLVQSMYNIVDSIFVSHFDPRALTAVSLCFPIQTLMIAFGNGTSIGVNSILSRKLGEGDRAGATKVALTGVFLALITSIVFAIAGGFTANKIFGFFTEDPETAKMASQYMWWCTVFSLGTFMQNIGEKLLISTGKTTYSMISQMSGAVINIILDPILIFGLLGAPKLGISGAAIATIIGQWGAMIIAFSFNALKNKEISLNNRKKDLFYL
ncbi:MAG: polysaccharide biosynthesis C-terminal domain-containing protein, partial [Bacteroidaceae bacterium]|nr:polysaccharide biosynthesis C-terminal domain-containing protein [Bacteroidaceae bacterium]